MMFLDVAKLVGRHEFTQVQLDLRVSVNKFPAIKWSTHYRKKRKSLTLSTKNHDRFVAGKRYTVN